MKQIVLISKKNVYGKNIFLLLGICFFQLSVWAQSPTIKIDFNQSGRQESEVNETDYEAWGTYSDPVSNTYDGVTFTLSKSSDNGTGLSSNWYKAGISAAQLVSDGVRVSDGTDGGAILLTISGLTAGENSLLLYLNNVDSPDGNTFSPIDIYLNGELVEDNFEPSVRAASNYDATYVYLTFDVTEGNDVTVLVEADVDADATATNKNVIINGLELNTEDVANQATEPAPEDNDTHVEVNSAGQVELSWTAADAAVSHNVYFSEDEDELEAATTTDNAYKGNQSENIYAVSNLDNHSTYFWRIDEVQSDGTVTKGNIWSFEIAHLAFPGAEGYGRYAKGGRGGKVVHVTNLNDSGEGSLRYAIEEETGTRTIVFDVSGIIALESNLTLNDSCVTIAGQTAPGKGICIRNRTFGMSGANDVIIQNIRSRRGSEADTDSGLDGMGMQGSEYCIIDHCSISWTIDEAFSSRSAENITLQRTFISEALNIAGHPNYSAGTKHGYAASISGDIGSFHHNLLAHCEGRNWSLAGGLDGNGYYAGRLDITNNVVYNWGHRATDGGAMEVNFVNNYYKPGAATDLFYALIMNHEATGLGTQQAYFSGNVMPGYFNEDNQEDGRTSTIDDGAVVDYDTFLDEAFFDSYVTTQTAEGAYKNVLSDIGCNQPVFDDHDTRVREETLNGTYTYTGSVSGIAGLPDTDSDVGGYETYTEKTRSDNWDTDGDGLPDWWESYYNLDTNSASGVYTDSNNDDDGDGYTQLEDYLQWMAKPHYIVLTDSIINIDLADMFYGYTNSPSYVVSDMVNASVIISDATATVTGTATGMASFILTVTDGDGDSMSKTVGVFYTDDDEIVTSISKTAKDEESKLSIYPNPVSSTQVYIQGYENQDVLYAVSVLSLQGNVLKTEEMNLALNGSYETEVSVSELKPGIYLIKVEFESKSKIIRFVKQ